MSAENRSGLALLDVAALAGGALLLLALLFGSRIWLSPDPPPQTASASRAEALAIITPLIDPAKLDTLKGERAANPRLRAVNAE